MIDWNFSTELDDLERAIGDRRHREIRQIALNILNNCDYRQNSPQVLAARKALADLRVVSSEQGRQQP